MMGFAPFDHGALSLPALLSSSSSSSSTLSPLAPPFTVDRSLSTPKLATPLHDLEDPWLHLHPPMSTSNSIPPPNPEVIPIVTSYGYFGPQPISSPTTNLSSLIATAHGFAFGQRPEAAKSSLLEAEPYFPRYPATIPDKNASVSKEFVYGISNSRASPSEGSCESGYGDNSSGFGHTAKQTSQWMEAGRTVPNYDNHLHLGGPAAEGFVAPVETLGVWHGNCVESLAKKAHIGSKGTGSERLDATYTASSWENAGPFNMTGSSVFVPCSVLQEASYSRISDAEPPIKTWDAFNLNKTSYDKCFVQPESCTKGPGIFYPSRTTFSFNMSGPSIETVAPKDVHSRDRSAYVCNKDNVAGCDSANVNAGVDECNADTTRIRNEMSKNYQTLLDFPPMKRDLPSKLKPVVSLRYPSKEKSKLKVTQLSASKVFTSAPDTSRPGDSMGSSPEILDQFIPAIDSPCWKGTPSSQHSPFGFVEAPVHPPLVKESKGSIYLNKQNQLLPSIVDDAAVSSLKLPKNSIYLETGCVKNSSLSYSGKPTSVVTFSCSEHISTDASKFGSDCLKVNNGKGTQSSNSFELETSDVKPLSHKKDDFAYTKKPTSESRVADSGTDFNREDQNVSFDFFPHAREHESNVSSSGVTVSNEISDMHGASDVTSDHSSRLDAQMLVKTIHNLSELLLSCLYSNGNALKEHDYDVLQLVIGNLDACVFNRVGSMRPMLASFPGLGSSYCLKKSTDPREGTSTGGSPFTGKEDDVMSQSNHQSIHNKEVNIHSCKSSKKVDKFHDDNSSGNMDFEKDNEMTQAIKKVMKENIRDQGEMQPHTLLFKNLWIEAEAALCSTKYELRLAHMKTGLEKYKQHQATGAGADPHGSSNTSMEKSSNTNAIGGSDEDDCLAPKLNVNLTENVITLEEDVAESSYRNPREVSHLSVIDETKDLESSVMARFKVLQNREENLSLTCKAEQKQLPDTIDIGERHGTMPSPGCLGKQLDVGMDITTKVVNLGFAEMRKPWPFINSRLEGESREVRNGQDVEHFGGNSTDNIDFCLDFSKQNEVSECIIGIADEVVSQSVVPRQFGNQLSTSGHDSPSSDWEHILKEELSL